MSGKELYQGPLVEGDTVYYIGSSDMFDEPENPAVIKRAEIDRIKCLPDGKRKYRIIRPYHTALFERDISPHELFTPEDVRTIIDNDPYFLSSDSESIAKVLDDSYSHKNLLIVMGGVVIERELTY